MKTAKWHALCVALAILAIAAAAQAGDAPPKKKIMLGAFAATALPPDQARAIENLVCADLAANRTYDVVCPDDVGAVIKEQQLKMGLGACPEGDCMNVTEKMMESDLTVRGTIDAVGGKYVFTLVIAETGNDRQLAKASVETGQNVEKLTGRIKGLVGDLYKNLAAPPPEKKPETPPPPAPPPAPPKDEKKK